jgi:hypothetical protein
VLNIVGNRTDTEPSEPHIRWARDTWDASAPIRSAIPT